MSRYAGATGRSVRSMARWAGETGWEEKENRWARRSRWVWEAAGGWVSCHSSRQASSAVIRARFRRTSAVMGGGPLGGC
jgi:hypothetical protein